MNGALPLAAGKRETHLRCLLCSGKELGVLSATCQNPSSPAVHPGPSSTRGQGEENETERGKALPQSSSYTCCGEQEAISPSGQAKVTPSLPLGTPLGSL